MKLFTVMATILLLTMPSQAQVVLEEYFEGYKTASVVGDEVIVMGAQHLMTLRDGAVEQWVWFSGKTGQVGAYATKVDGRYMVVDTAGGVWAYSVEQQDFTSVPCAPLDATLHIYVLDEALYGVSGSEVWSVRSSNGTFTSELAYDYIDEIRGIRAANDTITVTLETDSVFVFDAASASAPISRTVYIERLQGVNPIYTLGWHQGVFVEAFSGTERANVRLEYRSSTGEKRSLASSIHYRLNPYSLSFSGDSVIIGLSFKRTIVFEGPEFRVINDWQLPVQSVLSSQMLSAQGVAYLHGSVYVVGSVNSIGVGRPTADTLESISGMSDRNYEVDVSLWNGSGEWALAGRGNCSFSTDSGVTWQASRLIFNGVATTVSPFVYGTYLASGDVYARSVNATQFLFSRISGLRTELNSDSSTAECRKSSGGFWAVYGQPVRVGFRVDVLSPIEEIAHLSLPAFPASKIVEVGGAPIVSSVYQAAEPCSDCVTPNYLSLEVVNPTAGTTSVTTIPSLEWANQLVVLDGSDVACLAQSNLTADQGALVLAVIDVNSGNVRRVDLGGRIVTHIFRTKELTAVATDDGYVGISSDRLQSFTWLSMSEGQNAGVGFLADHPKGGYLVSRYHRGARSLAHMQFETSTSMNEEVEVSHSCPEVLVFPNPTAGLIHLRLEADQAFCVYRLLVVDQQGLVVNQRDLVDGELGVRQETTMDVTNIPSGAYLIVVESVHGTCVERFIKID